MAVRANVDRVCSHPLAYIAGLLIGRHDLVKNAENRFIECQIDALAFTRRLARPQRNQRSDSAVHAGHVVGERRRAWHDRHTPRFAGEIRQSREGVCDTRESGLSAKRPILSIRRNADKNGARVDRLEIVVSKAPLLERARAEILDDDVALGRELPQQLPPALLLQVQRNALLVPALSKPEKRVAALGIGAKAAQRIADLRRLDLDDLGAELAENRGAVWARDKSAQVEHPYPF